MLFCIQCYHAATIYLCYSALNVTMLQYSALITQYYYNVNISIFQQLVHKIFNILLKCGGWQREAQHDTSINICLWIYSCCGKEGKWEGAIQVIQYHNWRLKSSTFVNSKMSLKKIILHTMYDCAFVCVCNDTVQLQKLWICAKTA